MKIAAPLASRIGPEAIVIDPAGTLEPAMLEGLEVPPTWAGRRVALQGSAVSLTRWLVLLDGVVEAFLFVPRSACRTLCERIVQTGEADCVLRDADPADSPWAELKVPCIVDSDPAAPLTAAPEGDAGPAPETTQWVLPTSGTMNVPKLVAHTLDSLAATARRDKRFTDYRWGLLYDPARMAGLQVLLQALIGNATLLDPDPEQSLVDQVAWLEASGCSAISATPTQWRRLLMTPAGRRLPLRQITLGGEIADEATLSALARTWPSARVTHVYASTEAGVGFAVHDGRPGFPASWMGQTRGGVRMRIGEDGCLLLARQEMSQSYLGEAPELVEDGWIDTGDLVEVEKDRVLFLGRANGAINVGGNKVIPEEVERVIGSLEGVASVLVRGKQSSVMGMLVEALVQPATGSALESRDIKAHCRSRLAAYKVPAFVRLVDELPVSASGKLQRSLS